LGTLKESFENAFENLGVGIYSTEIKNGFWTNGDDHGG
jgi:hypothetical protein